MTVLHTMTVMHTMNTMHAMTGSYDIRAMLEKNGNPERFFVEAVAGRLWPDRNPCSAPIICLILHGSNLLPLSRKRDCRSRASKSAGWRILSAPADSKVCFGMPENPAPRNLRPFCEGRIGFDSEVVKPQNPKCDGKEDQRTAPQCRSMRYR